jgi:hypothetical protein
MTTFPQIRDSPKLEGQVPVFISRRNRVARLHPQELGSLFVASYDSQGYDIGIPALAAEPESYKCTDIKTAKGQFLG